jgi:hypothetical protein
VTAQGTSSAPRPVHKKSGEEKEAAGWLHPPNRTQCPQCGNTAGSQRPYRRAALQFKMLDVLRRWLRHAARSDANGPNTNSGQMCYRVHRGILYPSRFWEDMAMRFLSLFVASPAVAILSIELFCGLSGPAMSQTSTGSAASLPSVMVEAPRRAARPKRSAVVRSTVSRGTSPTTQTTSAASDSDSAKLAKLARITGSCVDGCVTSFRTGNSPWVGCNGSAWPALSSTCRNVGNYQSYQECRESGMLVGWRVTEVSWYCSSPAIKYAWAQ